MSRSQVFTVGEAAVLLGYSRSSVYARLKEGSLTRSTDDAGRSGVDPDSVQTFLASPPPRARPRGPKDDRGNGDRSKSPDHRETVTRLQMVREAEARSREAERQAAKHLRKALKWQQQATAHQAEVSHQMDELLIQFMTPDSLAEDRN